MLMATFAAHPAVIEAEESRPSPACRRSHDPGLGLLGREAHLGQDRPKRLERRLGLPSVLAEHHQVIRVTPQRSAPALGPLPVKPVQIDVAQNRRERHRPAAFRSRRGGQRPSSMAPARNIARRSFSRCRSLIRSSIAAIDPESGISPEQLAMSVSAAYRLPLQD